MSKTTNEKIEGTAEAWETVLGASLSHARASTVSSEVVDDALELQMISIRLEKELIAALKAIAAIHGIGYQPLIREQLHRFASAEAKRLLIQNTENLLPKKTRGTAPEEDCPDPEPMCAAVR